MSTYDRIKNTLDEINAEYDGQVNLNSNMMRECLADKIYEAVMKRGREGTHNEEQLEIFTHIESPGHK